MAFAHLLAGPLLSSTAAHPGLHLLAHPAPLWTLTQPPSLTAGFSPDPRFTSVSSTSTAFKLPLHTQASTGFPAWTLPTCALKQSFTKQPPIALQIKTKLLNMSARCCLLLAPAQLTTPPSSPLPSPTAHLSAPRFTQFPLPQGLCTGQPLCLKCSPMGWAPLALAQDS